MNWRIPEGSHDPLMLGLGRVLEQEEALSPGLFPNLRDDEELVIACDYSGEHQQSNYSVISFIITNVGGLKKWEYERLAIRREFLSDGRRMAFKNLSDSKRQMAFYFFLKATAELNGLLLCMAIDKEVTTAC